MMQIVYHIEKLKELTWKNVDDVRIREFLQADLRNFWDLVKKGLAK